MKRFFERFQPDSPPTTLPAEPFLAAIESIASGVSDFLTRYGGCSFQHGLYRSHTQSSALHWTRLTTEAFPRLDTRIFCFGYDWLGRQFVLDRARMENGQAQVLLCDLGFDDILEIPASFAAFHDIELVDFSDEALAKSFFLRWLAAGGAQPTQGQCIGYRIPPKLGGADEIKNLELMDMEVYWSFTSQINAKIRNEN